MKYFSTLILVIFFKNCSGQVIKSKDGVSLGNRSDIISSCTMGADSLLMSINGLEVETYQYCACACDKLIPTINSWEIEKAIKENKLTELFLSGKNFEILFGCFEGKYKIQKDYKYNYSDNPELQKKIGIKKCIQEIMKDTATSDIWSQEFAEEYCDCAINKLLSSGYTYKIILELESENSVAYNEIAVPCLVELLKNKTGFKSLNTYIISDIEGGGNHCLVPLIDYYGQGYKIKVSIGGITKYYLFDTGASDLVIDSDTERELLLTGALKKDSYLNKTEYTLANNQTVNAQLVKVDNITIGDYTIQNVIIAIIDEGALLCGKSFLDKFNKWELDIDNKMLILYK